MGEDFAALAMRLIVGAFFVLARFRWVYDPAGASIGWTSEQGEPMLATNGGRWFNVYRHEHLRWKVCACGFGNSRILAGMVALVEIGAGAFLVIGLLTQLAAFGLLVVTIGATLCTAREKIDRQNPVDTIDRAACYLWLVEPHLIAACVAIIAAGPGLFSLDRALEVPSW